ncbi:MAG: metal ABC transporter ATP-binding protein [Eubacteriales bacterium]|nr:metal ABC transporter ATP-binding protein [Eubacteriales bacterium]
MLDIEIKNLSFAYTADKVIDGLNFNVEKGDLVAVVGENGSGKSTLMKLIIGELKPDTGEVKICGEAVRKLKSLRHIGYVPQVQNFNQITFPTTTLELVVLNLYEDFGLLKIPRRRHKQKALEVLDELGLKHFAKVPFKELSGGLKQRTMIARAMMNETKVLVLDEPTAGVDQESKEQFLKLIKRMNSEEGITTIIVTHEIETLAEGLDFDAIYKMEEGRLSNVRI